MNVLHTLTRLIQLSLDVALEGGCQRRQYVERQLTGIWNRARVLLGWQTCHILYESFSSWQIFKNDALASYCIDVMLG